MHCFRDTIQMKNMSSGSIIREGMKELRRSAFSTPSISRRNSTETMPTRRHSHDIKENHLTVSSVSSLVNFLS